MLTGFRVENFKNFQDTSEIDLAPLTLLSGINSAGKSSLIQMLLLLKQTLESSPSQVLNPGQGPFLATSLGDNFNDFLFGRPKLSEARLTYHLSFAYDPNHEDEANLYDALRGLLAELKLEWHGGISSEVVVGFGWQANGHRGTSSVYVANLEIKLFVGQQSLIVLHVQSEGDSKARKPEKVRASNFGNFQFGQIQVVGYAGFLPTSLIIYSQQATQDITASFGTLFHHLFTALRRDLSEKIYYLNSFRTPPSRVYTTGQTAGMVLNPNGSNFAEVWWRFGEQPVCFVDPTGNKQELPLRDMVARVLSNTLGLKQAVQVKPVAEGLDILEVKVETLGATPTPVTLADVGLGYNQILQIIVQGLLTPPGALVIFEQPEIHLHPDVQARLIHFFAGLARAGRRVLVETHSTFMVDHLCLAIVKDRSNWLAENSKVLFIHPADQDHASARIEPVQITPYGKKINYSLHFLPDVAAIYGEILKEGFAKRREEKTSA